MELIQVISRKSKLAVAQTNVVIKSIKQHYANLNFSIKKISTKGDKLLTTSLSKIGGKGLFVKELEQNLLTGNFDFAVHSMKDMPLKQHKDLMIVAITSREIAEDVFISNKFSSLDDLPKGAIIGTSSLRRQSQVLKYRSDLIIKLLRGNVITRITKLDSGEYDAIILAAAGLIRLGLEHRIRCHLSPKICLPAINQGFLAIETTKKNIKLNKILATIHNKEANILAKTEQSFKESLNCDCHSPVAALATKISNNQLKLIARVIMFDGSQMIEEQGISSFNLNAGIKLGKLLADRLIEQGALEIITKSLTNA